MRRKLFNDSTSDNRRKLFSEGYTKPTRRKLFSNDECKLPPESSDKKVVKCMDCGQTYEYDGSSLNIICPKCGGDRFEIIDNITNSDLIEPNDLNPVDKVFSEKRRKLFCNEKPIPENPSGSLTHQNPGPEKDEMTYTCPDCGYTFTSNEQYVDQVNCPKCGGNRCRREYVDNEIMFSGNEDELDELLSKYKGKSVKEDDLEAELHARGIYDEVGGINGLVDKGYAEETEDGQVMFSDIADFQKKMFSKLVISVTKEFDIEPVHDRNSVIDSLAERFPGKPIMVLKKTQSTIEPEMVSFSDKSYLKDSGIESDIKVEYGGQNMPIKEFMRLLNDEYPDAPEDIIELLESSKTIKVNGGKVLISK